MPVLWGLFCTVFNKVEQFALEFGRLDVVEHFIGNGLLPDLDVGRDLFLGPLLAGFVLDVERDEFVSAVVFFLEFDLCSSVLHHELQGVDEGSLDVWGPLVVVRKVFGRYYRSGVHSHGCGGIFRSIAVTGTCTCDISR